MANNIQTRIRLRKDMLSTWMSVNPILADGELAIVLNENGNDNIKLGNGLSSFNDLPYLFQHSFETDKISTKEITAKSISQGYNVKSTPTSFATGIFTEADGNFGVVHGIEAKIISSDDYAFVFNGENLPGITERYTSHGEGTFNVNPLSGLNGFYIGEQSLSSIFNNYFLNSEISNYYNKSQINGLWLDLDNKIVVVDSKLSDYYKKSETSSSQEIQSALDSKVKVGKYENEQYLLSSQDLSIVNIAADDYYKLVAEEKVDKSIVYILSSDNINAHGQTIINVANPILSSDAATKAYVDSSISGIDLSEYYKKTETSSSSELSGEFKKYQLSGNYLLSSNLSFNYDSSSKYIHLKAFGNDIGTVNCADFIKDGMLSSACLCGNVLILTFNTDAGKTPISVNLSSFVDNYGEQIKDLSSNLSSLSSKVDIIGSDYLDSSDKTDILNQCLSPDEVKLYRGPGDKDISLSVGTGTQLCVYTASLNDFYNSSETSSAVQLNTAFGNYYTKDELSVQVSATVDALMDRMLQMEYGNILTVEF